MSGNANSGRRPKPRALMVLEGNRGRRPLRNEPQLPLGLPPCPDTMPEHGRVMWAYLSERLGAVPGLLSAGDYLVMERLCRSYNRWREADDFLNVHGTVFLKYFVDPTGTEHTEPKARPEVSIAKGAAAEVDRLLAKLGLSPADRARLAVPTRGHDDENDIDAANGNAR